MASNPHRAGAHQPHALRESELPDYVAAGGVPGTHRLATRELPEWIQREVEDHHRRKRNAERWAQAGAAALVLALAAIVGPGALKLYRALDSAIDAARPIAP